MTQAVEQAARDMCADPASAAYGSPWLCGPSITLVSPLTGCIYDHAACTDADLLAFAFSGQTIPPPVAPVPLPAGGALLAAALALAVLVRKVWR